MQDNARYPEGVKKFTIDRGSPRTEDRKYFSAGYGESFFVFDASNYFKDLSVLRKFLIFTPGILILPLPLFYILILLYSPYSFTFCFLSIAHSPSRIHLHTSHIHLHSHHIHLHVHFSIISTFGTFISSYSSHGLIPIHNIHLHILIAIFIFIFAMFTQYESPFTSYLSPSCHNTLHIRHI